MTELRICMTVALVALLVLTLAAWAALALWKPVSEAFKGLLGTPFTLAALGVLAVGAVLYGGSKARVTFYNTDPEIVYIRDAGSYVTNDAVHVAYTRTPIVPTSANLIVERRRLDQTNDVDWVIHTNTTFAASPSPFDIQFVAATNWNWMVYTDWTPGPTVVTNGVWHTWWGEPRTNAVYIHATHLLPVRSAVRVDGETIATPKSERNAQNENQ